MDWYHKEVVAKVNILSPVHFVSFGGLSGLLRPASGTWGSLVAVLFGSILLYFDLEEGIFALCLCLTLWGGWLCDETTKALGVHDHSAIVIDEWLGIFLIYLLLYIAYGERLDLSSLSTFDFWLFTGVVFLSFRAFDIWKPFPIKWIDSKVENGVGIMLDDVVASLFAMIPILFFVELHLFD